MQAKQMSFWAALRYDYKNSPRSLYAGLMPAIWRASVITTAQCIGYDDSKDFLIRRGWDSTFVGKVGVKFTANSFLIQRMQEHILSQASWLDSLAQLCQILLMS